MQHEYNFFLKATFKIIQTLSQQIYMHLTNITPHPPPSIWSSHTHPHSLSHPPTHPHSPQPNPPTPITHIVDIVVCKENRTKKKKNYRIEKFKKLTNIKNKNLSKQLTKTTCNIVLNSDLFPYFMLKKRRCIKTKKRSSYKVYTVADCLCLNTEHFTCSANN